jgi:hypothetical protein
MNAPKVSLLQTTAHMGGAFDASVFAYAVYSVYSYYCGDTSPRLVPTPEGSDSR